MGKLDSLPTPAKERAKRGEMVSVEGSGDAQVLTLRSKTVRTLKGALEAGHVDTKEWEVERWVLNKWDMGAKLSVDGTDGLSAIELWQVKVWFCRKPAKRLRDALEEIHKRAAKYSPVYKYPKLKTEGDILAVVCLFDHHFGKLCWAEETGNNYDVRIAEKIWDHALEDLLGYVAPLGIQRFQLPIGQDFVNFDNQQGQTTAGTPQDNDGRYAKVIAAAYSALVRGTDRLSVIAPVDGELVMGNHDSTVSYHLARELKAHYRLTDRVKIGIDFRARKYLRWGTNLIGMAHADNVKGKFEALPTIMATETPKEWAATTHHEWLLGHVHHKSKRETLPVEERNGVVLRTLPSLSGLDAWHYAKGFLSKRAAEVYLYSKKRGYVGHFSVNAREK